MISRKEIKSISKSQLNRNGNWKIPVLLTALTTVVTLMSRGNTSTLMSLLFALVTSFINIYLVKACLEIAKSDENQKIEWKDTIISTNTFFKCIFYSVIISLLVMVISLGLALIGGSLFISIPLLAGIIWIASLLVGWVFSIYATFSIFIIIDKDADILEALKLSISLVKGRFWQVIIFSLSFILWYLLGIVTFGIAMLWIMPYMTVSFCNYYFDIDRN